MKKVTIFILTIISITTYGQEDWVPTFNGVQPLWTCTVDDLLDSDSPELYYSLPDVKIINDNVYILNSLMVDTLVSWEVEGRTLSRINRYTNGYSIDKISLIDGTHQWNNSYHTSSSSDHYKYMNRIHVDNGRLILMGTQVDSIVDTRFAWEKGRATFNLHRIIIDDITGETIESTTGNKEIWNSATRVIQNLIHSNRFLFAKPQFHVKKGFGYNFLVPDPDDLSIDSSQIVEWIEPFTMDDMYIIEPITVGNGGYFEEQNGILKFVSGAYNVTENYQFDYENLTYFEYDINDLEDIKLINTFPIETILTEKFLDPINKFIMFNAGPEFITFTNTHRKDGITAFAMSIMDYEGNHLGGWDEYLIEGEPQLLFTPFIYAGENMYHINRPLGDTAKLRVVELDLIEGPQVVGEINLKKGRLGKWKVKYDEKNHIIVLVDIIHELKLMYAAAFDADELGIQRGDPSATKEVKQVADYTIQPNPAIEHITVNMPEAFSGNLHILDQQGRIVDRVAADFVKDYQIDISAYPSGTYFLLPRSTDNYYELKSFIKVR